MSYLSSPQRRLLRESDGDLRRLQRLAAQGDLEAQRKLSRVQTRASEFPPVHSQARGLRRSAVVAVWDNNQRNWVQVSPATAVEIADAPNPQFIACFCWGDFKRLQSSVEHADILSRSGWNTLGIIPLVWIRTYDRLFNDIRIMGNRLPAEGEEDDGWANDIVNPADELNAHYTDQDYEGHGGALTSWWRGSDPHAEYRGKIGKPVREHYKWLLEVFNQVTGRQWGLCDRRNQS